MGTYVADKYVKGMINSTGCSVEEAFARTHSDPNNNNNTALSNSDIVEAALDLQFKKNKEIYKKRNLKFYKLLGQNYQALVSGILRGKDIQYKIPARYQMNSKNPFVLEWLLYYGRPAKIAQVRAMGPVKLNCIYDALESWIEEYPDEKKNWVYQKEWEEYFSTSKSVKKDTNPVKESTNRLKAIGEQLKERDGETVKVEWSDKKPDKKEEKLTTMKDILPELKFFTKKCDLSGAHAKGDVYISICTKQSKKYNVQDEKRLNIRLRGDSYKKFETGFIVMAVLNNRLYFKSVDATDGYKVMQSSSSNNVHVVQMNISKESSGLFDKFASTIPYDLKFDEAYQLYYVEVE